MRPGSPSWERFDGHEELREIMLMKKVVCLALLSLSALGAPNVARVDFLTVAGSVRGSAVLTAIPGQQIRVTVRVKDLEDATDFPPGFFAGIIISRNDGSFLGLGKIGLLSVNPSGFGFVTAVVTVPNGWDDDGDGDINGVVVVFANIFVNGRFTIFSEKFTLTLK